MSLRIDYSGLHDLVEEGQAQAEQKVERKKRVRRGAFKAARWVLAVAVLSVLPFVVLMRAGVYAYGVWGLGPRLALAVGVVATSLLLAVYAWGMGRRLGGGKTARKLLTRGAWGIAGAYVAYALVYVAGANVKSDEVRAEYRSLHPLLRVAASAVFVADGETVMTDAGRTAEDYRLMGLPVNEASLHFAQADGYVNALDLRTKGRTELRNRGLELAFWAMGLNTLRHVGTADHLHVSLRPPR